jgi:hypothetical protein
VVTRPERDFDYANFRLFYGPSEESVSERQILEVLRAKDGGSTGIDFLVDGNAAHVHFAVDFDEMEDQFVDGPVELEVAGESINAERAELTRAALKELEFYCAGGPPNGWHVSR